MAGYDVQQMGDATEISTTPEAVPAPWLLVAIPGTLLVLIALSMSFFRGIDCDGVCLWRDVSVDALEAGYAVSGPARFRVRRRGLR